MWWGEKLYVYKQAHPHPSGNSLKPKTRIGGIKIGWVYEQAEVSIKWRGVYWFWFWMFPSVSLEAH